MTREEKIKIMIRVRTSVYSMVQNLFDEIDKEIERHAFKSGRKVLVNSSKARLAIRAIRKEALQNINSMGVDNE